ncbi:Retrovirus-related Pol polyprotein LINE-1 [Gossypium australe]|uniref:Retrovirus-related Pol polyprotein LINE-1 n=1 Tax=Gossypium australe TaxID=47621 RepID=A0A5B6VYB3_9ROSI|nr:Retrovirus-related Pol polyprotein LINE-1 [Gossypium australe]
MNYVTSSYMQLLWNGALLDKFIPSRRVRQGDPLSPYLFVLVMERLGHMIEATMERGSWEPLLLSRKGPISSHLFFANDLMLFCRADDKDVDCLNHVLNSFCHYSCLHFNRLKTNVFFSRNLSKKVTSSLSAKLGFTKVDDLGKYLGVPFFRKKVRVDTFQFLVDKFRAKVNGWDVRKLSLASPFNLVKSVLITIPNYFMEFQHRSTMKFEKLARNILWRSSALERKVSLGSWDVCCAPSLNGGLGIKRLQDPNNLFLLKLGFNLVTNIEMFWVQELRNKYNFHRILPNDIQRSNCFYIWRSIANVWEDVKKGLTWVKLDGCLVNF